MLDILIILLILGWLFGFNVFGNGLIHLLLVILLIVVIARVAS